MEENDARNIAFHAMASLIFLHDFVYAMKDTPKQSVESFFAQWQEKIKWDLPEQYALLNTDVWLIHLYGLILIPQQTFIDQIPDVPLESLSTDIWGNLDIRLWPEGKPQTLRGLLRVLRNAMGHGRVSADPQCCFLFQDRLNERSPVHSIVAINHDDLFKFIKALGDGYMVKKWGGINY
jgi:hypothetical protein